jgi:hypothetical protein
MNAGALPALISPSVARGGSRGLVPTIPRMETAKRPHKPATFVGWGVIAH